MTVSQPRSRLLAAGLIAAFAVFWAWFATRHDLVQDEAYYWQWSRHLAAGYYDGPPLVAYVIHVGTFLLGNTELGVRIGAIACAAVAASFIYLLAEELFGASVGLIALAVALLNPLFGGGATIMTLDPVQLAFWSACAWTGWRAFHSGEKGWAWWMITGLLAGLTALSKLNGLLILPSMLLFATVEPTARRWLRRPQPYVAALLALAVFAPFFWWNATHGDAFWVHIIAMGSRTDGHPHRFTLKYLGEFIGAQAGLISPLIFVTLLWLLIVTPRRADVGPGRRYAWSLCVVVFAATCLLSLKSRVEANWAVACYVTGLILVASEVASSWARHPARLWHTTGIALAAAMTVLLYATTLSASGPRIKALDKRTDELYGWRAMAARVQQERESMGGDPFVFGVNYRMPSEMAFYLPGQPATYSLFLNDRANEYMFWETSQELLGRNGIIVNDSTTPDHLSDCRAVFARVVVEKPVMAYRYPYKQPIRTVQIFRCYGFKGYRRESWQRGW